MASICFLTAGHMVALAVQQFSLHWTHSIEKTHWSESWEIQGSELVLTHATIQNHGAGMEVPDGAVFDPATRTWTWHPQLRLPSLRLTRSEHTADYDWCDVHGCRPMGSILPTQTAITDITELKPCDPSTAE